MTTWTFTISQGSFYQKNMTRKEIEQLYVEEPNCFETDREEQWYKVGLKEGLAVADSHPNWISVEDYEKDELPPLMDKEDQYGCSVSVLFVVNLDDVQYINKGCFDYDIGVWHSMDTCQSYTKEQVTNWILLPQLPRKEAKNERTRNQKIL